MTSTTIGHLSDNEVRLGDYLLPLAGPVQRVKANTYASKVTIGDTKRSDQTLADEWVQSDLREGMLALLYDADDYRGRFWMNTVDTYHYWKTCLPPLVNNLGAPAGETNPIDMILPFVTQSSQLWVSFGGNLYTWDPTNNWSAKLGYLGAIPSDAFVWLGNMYWFLGPQGYTYGTSWATLSANLTASPTLVHCTPFDNKPNMKLVGIDTSGNIYESTTGAAGSWGTAINQITEGTVNGLLAYRDALDNPELILSTDTGLWTIDLSTYSLYRTALQVAQTAGAGKGACVWTDGNLYYPQGVSLWRYPRGGSIVNMGFNHDDGLPPFIRGQITNLQATPNFLLANVDARQLAATVPNSTPLTGTVTLTNGSTTVTGSGTQFTNQLVPNSALRFGSDTTTYGVATITDNTHLTLNSLYLGTTATGVGAVISNDGYLGADWGTYTFPNQSAAGNSAVLAYNNQGWHCVYLSAYETNSIGALCYTTLFNQGQRRLFIADGSQLNWINFPDGIYDPTQDTYNPGTQQGAQFASTGYLQTSYFYGHQAEIDKLAVSLTVRGIGITSTEVIDVFYDLDDAGTYGHYLGQVNASTIDSRGRASFNFNVGSGVLFSDISFKFVFSRGSDNTKTPALWYFDFRHKQRPDSLWGWTFKVDTSRIDRMENVWADIEALQNNKLLAQFAYRNQDALNTYWVDIVSIEGQELGGTGGNGVFTITVVELSPDGQNF